MPEQNYEGRTVLVEKINAQLSAFTAAVTSGVKNNLSTRNVLAETTVAGLLNRIFNWKLVNANGIRSNFPAVDLVDMDARVAVQVTSTNTVKKIDHTLEKFTEHNLSANFDRLYVVIITADSATASMHDRKLHEIFCGQDDIWNIPALLGKIKELETPVLEDILDYLEREVGKVAGLKPYLYARPRNTLGDGFVGREMELGSIRMQLNQGIKPVVLSGLGGMGKTELASRFGNLYTEGNVYMIRFQTSFTATITAMYANIHPAPTQQPDEEAQLKAVMELLSQCGAEDLLIIDNVDADSGSLADLMGDPVYQKLLNLRPRILITTRFDRDRAIPVGPLPDSDLHQIFRAHDADLTQQQMDALIQAVNKHTMTIDLMARTLNGKGWKKVTAEDMLRAIRENTLPAEKYRKIATDYNQSEEQARIYQHLSVVFDASGVPESGKNVLRCAALLPETGMDGSSFGESLPEEQQEALDELLEHGWLSMEKDLLQIHPVVRMVCIAELQPTDESCGDFLRAVWSQYDPNRYDAEKYRQYAGLFSQAAALLENKDADWAIYAGFFWKEIGQPGNALEHEKQAVRRLEESQPDSPDLAIAYNNVGISYDEMGDHSKALEFKLKALKIQEKVLPTDHPHLATSYNNVGISYGELGDHQKALEYQLKALAIWERVFPGDHPDLAASYNNLGITYGHLGDHQKALEYLLKALKIREKVLPADHPDLAASYNNVGDSYGKLGDHKKELEYKLKALAIYEKVLPADHPDLATSYNNVGGSYGDLGYYQKAMEFKLKALKIREKVLPADHPSLATSYNNVGTAYGDLGDHKKELEFKLKALEILEKVFPADHPSLAASYNNVGITYGDLGDHKKALEYLLKALKIREKVLPADHPSLATSYNNVGISYSHLCDHNKALEYLLKALAIREKVLPADHPSLATSYNNVGITYGDLGDYGLALEYLNKAIAIWEKKLPAGHPDTRSTRQSIQLFQKLHQMQQNMAKAVFKFADLFTSFIRPKK